MLFVCERVKLIRKFEIIERKRARSFFFYLHGFCTTFMRAREFVLVTVKSIKATEMQSNKEKNIYILHTYIYT